ncbi:hypothetical protein D3C71_643740 [compost metagenome]
MVVQTAVLMDDNDRADGAGRRFRCNEVTLHLAGGAGICHLFRDDPRIIGCYDCRTGAVGGKQRGDCRGGRTGAGQHGELFHEFAAVEAEMGIFIISVDHGLRNLGLVHRSILLERTDAEG